MPYKALYRSYRPKTFFEVAGQRVIVKTLQNALLHQKLSHAYLFAGPRGTGKTTMAKLLAKALNCEQGVGQQCNTCEQCRLLNDNAHPDIIEIDAASNNGVDEVRYLIDKVKYSPIKGRYKVYIIDEVHMMTPGAFNALLKTLEEPPAHVIFVLATTEAHKILPTIISRCQRFDFGKVQHDDITARLETVLKQEKINIDPLALKAIIDLADGGVRDALSLLDQVIAYTNANVKEADVLQLFGLISQSDKIRLFEAIGTKQSETIANLLQSMQAQGADFKRLILDLLDMLKDVLLLLQTKQPSILLRLTSADAERILEALGQEGVTSLVPLLMGLLTDFKSISQLPLLLEMSLLHHVANRIDKAIMPTMNQVLEKNQQPQSQPLQPSFATQSLPLVSEGDAVYIDDVNIVKIMVAGDKEKKQSVIEQWQNLSTLSYDPRLGKVAALLKQGKPYVLSHHVLVLEFEQAQDAKQVNLVLNQDACQTVYEHIMHEKILLYGVNRQESIKLRKLFLDLSQLGQLPAKTSHPPTVKNWTLS